MAAVLLGAAVEVVPAAVAADPGMLDGRGLVGAVEAGDDEDLGKLVLADLLDQFLLVGIGRGIEDVGLGGGADDAVLADGLQKERDMASQGDERLVFLAQRRIDGTEVRIVLQGDAFLLVGKIEGIVDLLAGEGQNRGEGNGKGWND